MSRDTDDHSDLAPQPVPEAARCPACGGDPAPDVAHRLSAVGYTHDDQQIHCADCGHQWICGVPIGEFDRPELADALVCPCGTWRLVHRVELTDDETVTLHLKCPECYSFVKEDRQFGEQHVAPVGYPQTTGRTEGCPPYGQPADRG